MGYDTGDKSPKILKFVSLSVRSLSCQKYMEKINF